MPTRPSFVAILRWTARVIGALIVLLIAALTVGEGVPNPLHQPTVVMVYLQVLKLAAEVSVEKVEPLLREHLAGPGKCVGVHAVESASPIAATNQAVTCFHTIFHATAKIK